MLSGDDPPLRPRRPLSPPARRSRRQRLLFSVRSTSPLDLVAGIGPAARRADVEPPGIAQAKRLQHALVLESGPQTGGPFIPRVHPPTPRRARIPGGVV